MKTETLHSIVGGAVIFTSMALGVVWSGNGKIEESDHSYRLNAVFSKIDGISVGSDVLIAGIPVGKVVHEEMNTKNHQVTVGMQIHSDIEIPYDSSAQITSDGIFGAKYISVNIGGDFEMLEDGDTFEFIRDSVIFEEIFEKVIQMGEAGLEKRKAAAKDQAPTTNIFETDESLFD